MLDNTTLEVSAAENMASTSPAQPDSATDVGQEHQHLDDTSDGDDQAESPLEPNGAGERPNKPSGPVQKRRRVTRACDECRRKKIKCDGKQPCTHCTVYSYDCTYDQPSNRRRNPAPQYIEALETRLHKAELLLRTVLPGVDLDDPKYDARSIDQILQSSKEQQPSSAPPERTKPDEEGQLQTMISQTGSIDLDDRGHWDFHGHSSGYAFMRKLNSQFGGSTMIDPRMPATFWQPHMKMLMDSPKSAPSSSPQDISPSGSDLPPKEVALNLSRNCIDDCCALMRPFHRPTFFKRLDRIYNTDPDQYTNADTQFLPLLYVVMAVGCMFAKTENEQTMLDTKGYQEAMEQGYQYFNAARQMIDITDCRDLISLQTVVLMIIFLQSTAKLSTCYAYVGIALRACCRLGLHRKVSASFNPLEQEERKRTFWIVRKLDAYVGAMLGLPQMLSDDDIDQDLPAEVDDNYITEDGILPMPPGIVPLIQGTNAHTRLTDILRKVVRYIYPLKKHKAASQDQSYSISHQKIRELEQDLQQWMDALAPELRPDFDRSADLSRVQHLLRMAYAHVQMMMYRPFIHYVVQGCSADVKVDKRSFACAAACVSVARNIVHITTEMKKRGLLVGAYWFVMYTTYFAILSLVFFVLSNPDSPTGKEILKDALEGRDTLASLARRSLAADRCTFSLTSLFNDLPDKLQARRVSIQSSTPPAGKKRGHGAHQPPTLIQTQHTMPADINREPRDKISPTRARTMPQDWLAKIAKGNSMPDPTIQSPYAINNLWSSYPSSQNSNLPTFSSSSGASPEEDTSPTVNTNLQQVDHSASIDSGGGIFAHSTISDLNTVMFPNDNPFAYPNQPISTLEDTQYMTPEQTQESFPLTGAPSEIDASNGPSASNSGISAQTEYANSFEPNHSFHMLPQSPYAAAPNNIHQSYPFNPQAQANRHFPVPTSWGMGGPAGPSVANKFETTQSQQQPPPGSFGMRANAVVNLDDLFGGDSWVLNGSAWDTNFGRMSGEQGPEWKSE